MKRILPPLVVALLLAVVVWRVARDDQRSIARERLMARWGMSQVDPLVQEETLEETKRYVANYGHILEDRWFAARSLLKSGLPVAAVEVVRDDPTLRETEGTGHRLAGLILRTTGFREDDTLGAPRQGSGVVLSVLADGGDDDAEALLRARSEDEPWERLDTLLLATYQFGGSRVRETLTESLRVRGDEEGRRGAAILAARPEPYPQREADAGALTEFVNTTPTEQNRLEWSMACRALGRIGTPEALSTLEALRERLAATPDPLGRMDAGMAALGLVGGGRWEALEAAEPFLDAQRPDPAFLDALLDVLVHRAHREDPRAVELLQTWWNQGQRWGPFGVRPRILVALFLRGEEPPAGDTPLATFAEDLGSPEPVPDVRAFAAAIALRRGDPAARDRLMALIQELSRLRGPQEDDGFGNPLAYTALFHATRALYLYDR